MAARFDPSVNKRLETIRKSWQSHDISLPPLPLAIMTVHPKKKKSNNNFTFTSKDFESAFAMNASKSTPSRCATPTPFSEQETAHPTKEKQPRQRGYSPEKRIARKASSKDDATKASRTNSPVAASESSSEEEDISTTPKSKRTLATSCLTRPLPTSLSSLNRLLVPQGGPSKSSWGDAVTEEEENCVIDTPSIPSTPHNPPTGNIEMANCTDNHPGLETQPSNAFPSIPTPTAEDIKPISQALKQVIDFISKNQVNNLVPDDTPAFISMGSFLWTLTRAAFDSRWDHFCIAQDPDSPALNQAIRNLYKSNTPKDIPRQTNYNRKISDRAMPASRVQPTQESTQYNNVARKLPKPRTPAPPRTSYAQAACTNTKKTPARPSTAEPDDLANILKLKEIFPELSSECILAIHQSGFGPNQQEHLEDTNSKPKTHIKMTSHGPSRKQVVVPTNKTIADRVLEYAAHVINLLNKALLTIHSGLKVESIWRAWKGISMATNGVALASDLSIIKKCLNNDMEFTDNDIGSPHLPQSKTYLKILGVLFWCNQSSLPVTPAQVEGILAKTPVFEGITLVSKPRIIRASPRSDMAVIWVDNWDSQKGTKGKCLINRTFNFGKHVATVRGTNMHTGVPLCHNCWRWGHPTHICRAQGSRCQKYGGSHHVENHQTMA